MNSAHTLTEDSREVRQKITKKLASSLRALQIRYVTTDDVITSDDNDANGLCVALEAVFVHGLKSKFIKMQTERRRKGRHVSLPQPAFWTLLKTITHRNVIGQLESLSYINTDVGRCRSWLRLALNDSLLECYFLTLRRENAHLLEYYQPFALMLDAEDCDVVLSYLQGLSSLSFDLSYKSSILNEWTASPLFLSGLWLDETGQAIESHRRKSLDSMSQSSSSDDTSNSLIGDGERKVESGSSSSQLSSSLGSDEHSRGSSAPVLSEGSAFPSPLTEIADSLKFSKSPEEDMDIGLTSASDTTSQSSPSHVLILEGPALEAQSDESPSSDASEPALEDTIESNHSISHLTTDTMEVPVLTSHSTSEAEEEADPPPEAPGATFELPKSRSWITEDDFIRADPRIPVEEIQPGYVSSSPSSDMGTEQAEEQSQPGKAFHVVHRRQIGQSNPFHGLLMLGCLERKHVLGLYKLYYCELTPYELRLQLEGDEQSSAETFSLLRCQSVGMAHSDGRFELQFNNKHLYMRATSTDEAQDWVDRITEAIQKFRPQRDEAWEILHFPTSGQNSSPRDASPSPLELWDWSSPLDVEADALKESVLYRRVDRKWTRFIFSLSERTLKSFLFRNLEKSLCEAYSIEMVRDILPDSSLGSPSCFRLVTTKGSLQLQAENAEEAKSWRELVRAAFLEAEEDLTFLPTLGNYQIKSHVKEHPLFRYLLHVPTEPGLDTQNFKCAGCHKRIGFQFGKAKLCAFSALYYCDLCHQDERSSVPSRIIHNWDVAERAISRQAVNFLKSVRHEPLFHLKYMNESLYQHTETMRAICYSREKLRLLGEYLMTCRSGALQELTASLDQRSYLLECAHTYSVRDLSQIADGEFEGYLQSAVVFASNHVFRCDLCSQRGFICQICNSNDIIYPFQFDTTTRCGDCKAVFHIPCKTPESQCPRCLRRKMYKNLDLKL